MTIRIEQLLPKPRGDTLELGWPLVEPLLKRALTADDISTDEMRALAEQDRMMIWAIFDPEKPLPLKAAGATGLQKAGDETVVEIQALGGADMKSWLDAALDEFENMAFEHGVDIIRIIGRRGWAKHLPDYLKVGMRPGKVMVLEKRIR